ncbi:MAG: ComEC/Rec2 family competence protein, partial [Actinobacteria bacterium]|nr:ComEC/Rec2 family competence protein [Actinomycetota bacterium]NIU17911.1 ComEC/Rec2 family competence protein [Actinomycetota bacterium]NIU64453.1 ComEC/Rec2 family competence protein [Actinomycetota bacterium]
MAAIAGLVFLARWRATRPALAAAAVVVVAGFVVPPSAPEASTVTFLDVGQGDAVLLQDGSGTSVLIDGGRDPGVLRRALGRRGVRHLDLVV